MDEHGVTLGLLTGQPVQLAHRNRPLSVRPLSAHDRVERDQRDGHVRRVRGHTSLRYAEDRGVATVTAQRRAP
jgi:hypothetical protein